MEKNNFYFNSCDNTFNKVLDSLSNTEVYSYKTSSLPLAEFWMPKNNQFSLEIIKNIGLTEEEYNTSKKIFEYPVKSVFEGKEIGEPSMTDLMIQTESKQIAIEGKFTENLYETINHWLKNYTENSMKPKVLEGWFSMVNKVCDDLEWDSEKKLIKENVVYQFLHRTASACSDIKRNPILVYQLFYDVHDEKSKEHQIDVAVNIQKFATKYLCFNKSKIKFYVVFTPIINLFEIKKKYSNEMGSLFIKMKSNNIYSFDDSIVVNVLEDEINMDILKNIKPTRYSNEEFLTESKNLWEETWHYGQDKVKYENDYMKKHPNYIGFEKNKHKSRYNNDVGASFEKLESTKAERWRYLINPGYKKYAVSSEGRVAFKYKNKYIIIKQDDYNDSGYLKLDPDGDYPLDHNIEVYKLIAMGFLGKTLSDGYDVHHKINNGYDCRVDNLVLLTRNQHNAVHCRNQSDIEKFLSEED